MLLPQLTLLKNILDKAPDDRTTTNASRTGTNPTIRQIEKEEEKPSEAVPKSSDF
jgi:hypothetical protein